MAKVALVCAVLILSGIAVMGQAAAVVPAVPAECVEMKTRLDRAETKLSDWPALARYREDNKKTAPPAKNEQRVVSWVIRSRTAGTVRIMAGSFRESRT